MHRTYIDGEHSIRIFHGAADDWVPAEACRDYVARLRRAGRDVALSEYPGAHHAFDAHTLPAALHLPNVQSGPTCRLEERPGGQMVFRDTGQPFGLTHPCIRGGATIGYDAQAHQAALKAVKEFLAATFKGP